jgi:mannan endo-1,4-beta-mannosidase
MTPSQVRSVVGGASRRRAPRATKYVILAICIAIVLGAALAMVAVRPWTARSVGSQSIRYLGVYEPDAPFSYSEVDQFAQAIGRQPNLVTYYSPWTELFKFSFASSASKHGATPLVELDPKNVSLASIASGQYDDYLRTYASEVEAFKSKVVLCFGHEMNGNWYSWGYQHTSARVFVAAWRHVVDVFRAVGATNVIWLWTVNIVDSDIPIPNPAPWWPGASYVTWVGIDGYYYTSSSTFAQLFGPTIVDVRALTRDPILITETGATPEAGQSAKLADLFSGVQTYGLLGFVWFDSYDIFQALNWRLQPAGLAAFRRDVKAYMRPLRPSVSTRQHSSPSASIP